MYALIRLFPLILLITLSFCKAEGDENERVIEPGQPVQLENSANDGGSIFEDTGLNLETIDGETATFTDRSTGLTQKVQEGDVIRDASGKRIGIVDEVIPQEGIVIIEE